MKEQFEPQAEGNEMHERIVPVGDICAEFLTSDDAEFLDELAVDEQLVYIYGRLHNEGYDPDEVLRAYGVMEGGENE